MEELVWTTSTLECSTKLCTPVWCEVCFGYEPYGTLRPLGKRINDFCLVQQAGWIDQTNEKARNFITQIGNRGPRVSGFPISKNSVNKHYEASQRTFAATLDGLAPDAQEGIDVLAVEISMSDLFADLATAS